MTTAGSTGVEGQLLCVGDGARILYGRFERLRVGILRNMPIDPCKMTGQVVSAGF